MLPQVLPTIGVALVLLTVTMMSVLSVPFDDRRGGPDDANRGYGISALIPDGDYAVANALGVVSLAYSRRAVLEFYLRHSLQQKGGES